METIADGSRFVQGYSSGGMNGIRLGGDGDASCGAEANHGHILGSGC